MNPRTSMRHDVSPVHTQEPTQSANDSAQPRSALAELSLEVPSLPPQEFDSGESRRISDAFKRTKVLIIRQSTMVQRRQNEGSDAAQRRAGAVVGMFGQTEADVEVLDMRGESASGIKARPQFNTLLERARRGEIGVILLARADRLSRNDVDSEAIFDAMRRHRGVIVVDGRVYDPNNPGDEMMLNIQATFAQYDQRMRTRWMMATRFALAQQLRYRRMLPSGLCWANPDDEVYRQRASESGSESWWRALRADPTRYRAWCNYREAPHFPLPYPDADVQKTVELRMGWFDKTGSITAVYRNIMNNDEWPAHRRGMVPLTSPTPFSSNSRVEWVPANKDALRSWLLNPALYGIYTFNPGRTGREKSEGLAVNAPAIYTPDAFPAFLPSARYEALRDGLVHAQRSWARGEPRVDMRLLPMMRCGTTLKDGSLCAQRLHLITSDKGERRYSGARCSAAHGYQTNLPPGPIEGCVLEVLSELMSDPALQTAVREAQLTGDSLAAESQRLQTEVARHKSEYAIARDMEKDARRRDDSLGVESAVEDQSRVRARWAALAARHDQLAAEDIRIQGLVGQDVDRILGLACRFDDLVSRARLANSSNSDHGIEALRSLLNVCIRHVYVRKVGRSSWEVDVVFPTGVTVRRTLFTHPLAVSEAEQVFISVRQQSGVGAEAIASELNSIAGTSRPRGPAWTSARVSGVIARLLSSSSGGPVQTHVPSGLAFFSTSIDASEAILGAGRPRRATPRGHGGDHSEAPSGFRHHNYRGLAKAAAARAESQGGGYSLEAPVASAKLAQLVKVPEIDVLRVALLGRLGPVLAGTGTVLLRPTDYMLHGEFPEYARSCIAKRMGWSLGNTARAAVLMHEYGLFVKGGLRAQLKADAKSVGVDARGVHYARRSWAAKHCEQSLVGKALTTALEQGPATFQSLERQYWRTGHLAIAEAKTDWESLARVAPVLEVPNGSRPKADVDKANAPVGPKGAPLYAWIGPDVMRELDHLELEAAVEALGRPELKLADFHQVLELLFHFSKRFGSLAPMTWERAKKGGRIIEVSARGFYEGRDSRRRPRRFAHVPAEVYDTTEKAVFLAWFGEVKL